MLFVHWMVGRDLTLFKNNIFQFLSPGGITSAQMQSRDLDIYTPIVRRNDIFKLEDALTRLNPEAQY